MLNILLSTCLTHVNSHLSGKLLNATLALLLCQPTLQVHKPSRQREAQTSDAQPCKKTKHAGGNCCQVPETAFLCSSLHSTATWHWVPALPQVRWLMQRELTCWAHYGLRNRFPLVSLGYSSFKFRLSFSHCRRSCEMQSCKAVPGDLGSLLMKPGEEGGQHWPVCAALPPSRFCALPGVCSSSSPCSWLSLALG